MRKIVAQLTTRRPLTYGVNSVGERATPVRPPVGLLTFSPRAF